MADRGVIVVGPDGQEYEFPPGSDPKRSAAIIKAKLGGGAEAQPQKPYEGSGVFQPRSFVGGTGANRLRDDSPPEEPGMLESMGRRMFQGAAQPETGGDFLGLATAAPLMGAAAAGQGISKAVGAIRSRTPSKPTQAGVGRLFSELAEGMPNPVGANPLVRPLRWAGKKLQERAASKAPQAVDGGTLVPNATNAHEKFTEAPPAPPPLPQSGPYHGSSGTGASAAPLQTPQVGWRQGSTPSGPVPDSRNATGSSRWFPERPTPPPPPPVGPLHGSTGTQAPTQLLQSQAGWRQGTAPPIKPVASHAREAVISQMKPDIRIPEQILADPKQLAIAAKALGLSVEELLKRQAQNFLSSNLNKY